MSKVTSGWRFTGDVLSNVVSKVRSRWHLLVSLVSATMVVALFTACTLFCGFAHQHFPYPEAWLWAVAALGAALVTVYLDLKIAVKVSSRCGIHGTLVMHVLAVTVLALLLFSSHKFEAACLLVILAPCDVFMVSKLVADYQTTAEQNAAAARPAK